MLHSLSKGLRGKMMSPLLGALSVSSTARRSELIELLSTALLPEQGKYPNLVRFDFTAAELEEQAKKAIAASKQVRRRLRAFPSFGIPASRPSAGFSPFLISKNPKK